MQKERCGSGRYAGQMDGRRGRSPSQVYLLLAGFLVFSTLATGIAWSQISIPTAGLIGTIAGNGSQGCTGSGGQATSSTMGQPYGIHLDSAGNVYFTDSSCAIVRKITRATGVMTTIAGSGQPGYSGDFGSPTSAELNNPTDVIVDGAGNVYIADSGNNRIRMISASTGEITTVAGNGGTGYSGDGGSAANAELHGPWGIAFDSSGNLYIADAINNVIREVSATTGDISTVAGNGTAGYSGDGGPATSAELNDPAYLVIDSSGNIYFADSNNDVVREVTVSTGKISTVAGTGTAGYAGDGGAATSATLNNPNGVGLDSSGNLYITDQNNSVLRLLTVSTGVITTIAGNGTAGFSGDGSAATSAEMNALLGVAIDSSNNIYIADTGNFRIRAVGAVTGGGSQKTTPTIAWNTPAPIDYGTPLSSTQLDATASVGGTFTYSPAAGTVLPSGTQTLAVTFTPADTTNYNTATATVQLAVSIVPAPGIITAIAGNGAQGCTGSGGQATSASLGNPTGVKLDASGNVYLADPGCGTVSEVNIATGVMATVAGDGTTGYSGDGGTATSAELDYPLDVAVDAAGDIYIADSGSYRVRKVTAGTGVITTVAGNGTAGYTGDGGAATSAELSEPGALALDSAGNLYIADHATNVVRKVAAATGVITTVAGNGTAGYSGDGSAATSAELNAPAGLAVDSAGNIYVADSENNVVRKVVYATGVITTVAGNGTGGDSGNGGTATSAELNIPAGVAVDASGNIYITENAGNVIRVVSASSGIINTIAGTGTAGYSGDGGTATTAEINSPSLMGLDGTGNIYFADTANLRIRAVGNSAGGGGGTKSTPTITWANPAAITYGTALSSAQLDASATVGGSFTYSPAAGTVLTAGSHTLSVTFTPTDTTDYNTATASVTITVNKATPVISWATPAAITYGAALSSTQLDASSTVGGAFVYTPASGTVLTAGTQTLSVTLTPTDTTDYNTATQTVSMVVNQAAPVLTWATPASISSGTALSTTQLDATASVPGTFSYTPAAGSLPAPGTDALSVIFTPTDTADYSTVYDWVPLGVSGTAPVINTVAGTYVAGYTGDGGPATAATFDGPYGIAFDSSGNLFIAECYNSVVRKVTAATGIITTVAGTGHYTYSGDGGPATSAGLSCPMGVAFDSSGNLYIAERWGDRIRKVTASTGIITTIAGNGTGGYTGDGGPATQAELYGPSGISVDAAGNVYYSDLYANVIRKITASTGTITTVAGNGTAGFSGDGGPATGAELDQPMDVVVDATGNLYIADRFNGRIRKVTASTGLITTVAGNVGATPGLITGAGGPYNDVGDVASNYIGDGGVATGAGVFWAERLAVDSAGNIYFSDRGHQRVREVNATTGMITTIAGNGSTGSTGDGGPATDAEVENPEGVAIGPNGDVYVIDLCNCSGARIRVIGTGGTPTVTWTAPAPIIYGTPLSSTQLDATASIPGTFTYNPPAGTVLPGGTNTVSVTFNPTDMLDYAPVTASVNITVNDASPAIAVVMGTDSVTYGQTTTVTVQVSCNSACGSVQFQLDGASWATGALNSSGSYTATTDNTWTAGTHTIQVSYLGNSDYAPANAQPQTLTVTPATPLITWNTPAAIDYGTTLSGAQLDATANVDGTFAYSPAIGSMPGPGNDTLTVTFTPSDPNYATTSDSVTLTVNPPALTSGVVYAYQVGYDPVGNVTSFSDNVPAQNNANPVVGTWNVTSNGNSGYDHLNRLSAMTVTPPGGSMQYMCWSYDAFGNRTDQQTTTGSGFTNSPGGACTPGSSAAVIANEWAHYTVDGTSNTADNGRNQITGSPAGIYQYDAAGNITYDGLIHYFYDAEGRLCAEQGGTGATLYLYDASGARVGKMSIPPSQSLPPVLSCNPAQAGAQMERSYILGPHGETMTMLDGGGNWKWTNVYAGGKLLATYTADTGSTHFHFTDMVGTRRMTTDYQGWAEIGFYSLPFGDGLTPVDPAIPAPTADYAPPMHFTGKERDAESGNDYFGARYYASSMGRWLSPDWAHDIDPIPYAILSEPQSLNLYSYVGNNPLSNRDEDGHTNEGCTTSTSTGQDGTIHVTVSCPQIQPPPTIYRIAPMFMFFAPRLALAGAGETSELCATGIGCAIPAALLTTAAALAVTNHFLNKKQPASNPFKGPPGGTSQTKKPDGTPKQVRRYGPDGYPETDVDFDDHGGQGNPHAHDWGRPSDGSAPTADDKSHPGRPVQPSDPQPQ